MENNLIPPISYEKLVKKLNLIRLVLWISALCGAGGITLFILHFEPDDIVTMWFLMSCFLFLIYSFLSWLEETSSFIFFKSIIKEMAFAYNWSCEKKLEDKHWNFIKDLENFPVLYDDCKGILTILSSSYELFSNIEKKFILYGNFCNRYFSFYSLIGSYGSTKRSVAERFILVKTNGVANFNNIILVTSIKENMEGYKDEKFVKVKLETQDMFDVYSTDSQKATEFLSQDFINALIEYVKLTGEKASFLFTSQGILFTKKIKPVNLPSLYLSSADKYIFEYWQSTENFIKLLDAINLLEKK